MIFDPKYALRLCYADSKLSCTAISIYTALGQYEEAVKLALDVNLVDLAKRIVNESVENTDPSDRKRLWLLIAKKVIEHTDGKNVSKAMDLLKESDLRLEDILPYFPNFVKIGDFKTEICKSLEKYNESIEKLKAEMDKYTQSATNIRKDIHELRNRSGFISSNQRCDVCSQPVLTRPLMLFPCTHVFHVDCVLREVKKYLDAYPERKQEWDKKKKEKKEKKAEEEDPKRREQRMLEEIAASQCILCGDVMIDSVHEPFIGREEQSEVETWRIVYS